MEQYRKDLKKLNKKIYEKQRNLFEIMNLHKIYNFNDKSLKQLNAEINLLEEIYDIKFEEYKRIKNEFWKNI